MSEDVPTWGCGLCLKTLRHQLTSYPAPAADQEANCDTKIHEVFSGFSLLWEESNLCHLYAWCRLLTPVCQLSCTGWAWRQIQNFANSPSTNTGGGAAIPWRLLYLLPCYQQYRETAHGSKGACLHGSQSGLLLVHHLHLHFPERWGDIGLYQYLWTFMAFTSMVSDCQV